MPHITKTPLSDLIRKKKKNVIIVSSTFLKKNPNFLLLIKENSLKFYKIKSNIPNFNSIEKLFKEIKKIKFNNLLGIGGGKVLDITKIINYKLNKKKLKKNLIAVPTLFGSGSEITSSAVYFKNKKKFTIQDKSIQPQTICINSNLLNKAKIKNIINSALDCLCQSIESIWAKKSTKNSRLIASESFRLSYNFLYQKKRNNIKQINKLANASLLVGKAMNITRTTAPHALSYNLTAHFGIPHGLAVALLMKYILKINLNKLGNSDKKRKILKLFKSRSLNDLIYKYEKIMSFNKCNYKLNLPDKKIDKISKEINIERLSNNPVFLSNHEIVDIYKSL